MELIRVRKLEQPLAYSYQSNVSVKSYHEIDLKLFFHWCSSEIMCLCLKMNREVLLTGTPDALSHCSLKARRNGEDRFIKGKLRISEF